MTNRTRDNLDQLRHIEGFPIGEDEDLHALSDPPHYTAYPNPHIAEFIEKWGKPYDEETDEYHREPYVADVSEGKNDPIYYAHTYHTKVPYKAIMRFIEHYTEPDDIVFDGFCGTGMTGIAAQMLGRRAILVDLCPAATFIAYNYNTPVDVTAFEREAKRILQEVEAECGWMYETWHPHCDHPSRMKGRINYTVWSDVSTCPYCADEIVSWDATVDPKTREIRKELRCPSCAAEVTKRDLTRATERVYDSALGREIQRARQLPVLINYSTRGKRYEKKPDAFDFELVRKIDESEIPYWYPTDEMPPGFNTEQPRRSHGATHAHHFYTQRNLWVLAAMWNRTGKAPGRSQAFVRFAITSFSVKTASRLHNIGFKGGSLNLAGQVPNTLYIPPASAERNLFDLFGRKTRDILRAFGPARYATLGTTVLATQSATDLPQIGSNQIDYIFVDPPFGQNIMYSEVSFIWESWLGALTNNKPEAIINSSQSKSLREYRELMMSSFAEMYRALKPGRWITVEFHNSKASVWNAIQEALAKAGFLVAQVTVLDKQQGTFKQMTSPGAVGNDLIINAYKPRKAFEERFLQQAGYGLEQEFVAQHLGMLPVEPNLERTAQMLYSKMLATYVQHGYQITLNADQFYRLLADHFLERDGFWFRDEEQVQEYERRKLTTKSTKGTKGAKGVPLAQQVLFISDERSAIAWLHHFLETPRDYSEIYTAFVKALQVPEDQIPEIKALLEENFVSSNGKYKRPEMLEKRELEARRQQRLLEEFEAILKQAQQGQRLKDVRKEAVLAGFTQCYRQKRFDDILRVGRKLHKRIVESSTEIYDFIDIAEAKVG